MKNLIISSSLALSFLLAGAPLAAHAQSVGYGGGGSSGGGGGAIIGGGASNPLPGAFPATGTIGVTASGSLGNIGGQVLGASTFNFSKDLWRGMHDSDVAQLQQFLVAQGYSIPDAVTDYFGSETFAAVKAFQAANGIRQTGYVGPLTRAALDKGVIPTTPEGN